MPAFLPCLPKQPPASILIFSNRPFDWSTLTRSTFWDACGVDSLAPKSLLRALRPFTWPPGEAHPCTDLLSLPSYDTGGCKPARFAAATFWREGIPNFAAARVLLFIVGTVFLPPLLQIVHTHTHTHPHTRTDTTTSSCRVTMPSGSKQGSGQGPTATGAGASPVTKG